VSNGSELHVGILTEMYCQPTEMHCPIKPIPRQYSAGGDTWTSFLHGGD
jgi:hypothetical protein